MSHVVLKGQYPLVRIRQHCPYFLILISMTDEVYTYHSYTSSVLSPKELRFAYVDTAECDIMKMVRRLPKRNKTRKHRRGIIYLV